MLPTIVGLYSPYPQCGKSTLAAHLVERYKYTKVSFADPLRTLCSSVLYHMGLTPEEVRYYLNTDKTAIIPGTICSGRELMRFTGTDFVRKRISSDFWLRCWQKTVDDLKEKGQFLIVTDDVRFPNEFDMLEQQNACMVAVTRRAARPKKPVPPRFLQPLLRNTPFVKSMFSYLHASDNRLRITDFSFILQNEGTLQELKYNFTSEVLMQTAPW